MNLKKIIIGLLSIAFFSLFVGGSAYSSWTREGGEGGDGPLPGEPGHPYQ